MKILSSRKYLDVALLPRCSMRDSLERGFGCLGPFVADYPYNSLNQCR